MFFFFEISSLLATSKYIDQHNVILKSIWQKQRDFMACASVQCKITNRIDLNLICLCLSVSIQHVQATRLIYSVSNVFAKTNWKRNIFPFMCQILLNFIDRIKKHHLILEHVILYVWFKQKIIYWLFISFIVLRILHMYKLFQIARET